MSVETYVDKWQSWNEFVKNSLGIKTKYLEKSGDNLAMHPMFLVTAGKFWNILKLAANLFEFAGNWLKYWWEISHKYVCVT